MRIDFAGGWSDVPDFAGEEGGAVLNAAIEPFVRGEARWTEKGLRVSYSLDLPPDAHLGTSSASNLAWIELIHGLTGKQVPPQERAEQAFRLEQLLGEKSGKQDHYAAALGGFNLMCFAGADAPADIRPLDLSHDAVAALQSRCLLCHSGLSQDSGQLHEQLWERFRQGDREVASILRSIRDSVEPACDALVRGDWRELGRCIAENRELARLLKAGAVTERMDALFAAGEQAGALGSKPCGAGGGGALLFLCEEGATDRVRTALEKAGGTMLAFRFAERRGDGSAR